jgi:pimeloyl-ACP methyl ester carboxylesterase
MEIAVDGAAVFAATGGHPPDPGRPHVVLLHGAGMDHGVWTLQSRYLARRSGNVLAPDLPGHGRSGGQPAERIEDLADWVIRLLDAVDVDQAAIAGHSMGALVALASAARHPARVRKIVLLGAAQAMPVHPDLLRAARDGDPAAVDFVLSWGFGRRAQLGGARVPGLWMLGGGARLLRQRGAAAALGADLAACAAYASGAEHAARVSCPALVIAGAQDRMAPPKGARALAAAIAGGRYIEIAESGHMMTIEQPDATLDAMVTAL